MPAPTTFDFSTAAGADKALKQIKQLMIRSGQPVISTEFNEKPKRASGVTYREATLSLASGQMVTLRVTATGDVYQVLLNGSVKPIQNHDDMLKAVAEIAGMATKNQAAFQKSEARKQIALPPGMTTTATNRVAALTDGVDQLDTLIAERKVTVADLQQQLGGVMTDSASAEPAPGSEGTTENLPLGESGEKAANDLGLEADILLDAIPATVVEPEALPVDEPPVLALGAAYVAAREISLAVPAMLDSATVAGAVDHLRMALDVVETNYPINIEAGNLDQAQLEQDLAKSFRAAIGMLDSAGPDLSDASLAELVNIAKLAAAEDTDIIDQGALAQLLALGLVETTEGLYMVTGKGKSALDDANYDVYGEPFDEGTED